MSIKIVSSIPMAMGEAKDAAFKAQKSARNVSFATIAAVLAAAAAIGSLFYQSWSLQRDYIEDVKVEINDLRINQNQKFNKFITLIKEQEATISNLNDKINNLKKITPAKSVLVPDAAKNNKGSNGKKN